MPRIAFFLLLLVSFVHADEYDDLRLKWRDTIVGTGYDTADTTVISRLNSIANAANSNWSSMDKSPTRTFLWSDLASTTVSIHINYSYQRLRSMALAYATPGCSLQGNPTLLADTLSGLDWMHANRYNATKSIYDNWYEFEIGSPIQLVDIAVLLYDQLSPTQISNFMGAVEKFTPSATTPAAGGTTGSFTGSNRMLKIRIVGVRGCVVKDAAKLAAARDAISNLFVYVTTGDGFYQDGSFIQHTNHPYTAAYGSGLLASIAPVMNWLSGSTWAVTDPMQSNVFSWVFDSYEPIIYNGAALDLVRGREAGRAGDPQGTGHTIMDSVLQIAQFAPPAESMRMKRMVKEWALSDTVRDFVSGRPLSTLILAKNLMADNSIVRRGELIEHYTFPEMDRVVHLGKGFCFGLSMCSTRIANFESINGNNLRGWFTGDGMTTLYNGDLNQFGDDTNCTIDAYRLPGVTADVTHSKLPNVSASIGPRAQGESTLSPHSWAGGATLGKFGAAGMQFRGVGVTLTGKKSWFMFDDEIVCLGAGITSTDARPIETTVENRKINGSNAFTVNGTAKSTALGWTEAMSSTSWAHLQGNVSGSDIGYYFPTAPTIRGVRESRSASPSEIDAGASTTIETRNFLRLSFDHGNSPTSTTYQYVLLPGRNATRTGNYAAAPQITVLNNNANVQAVRENTLGITAANFWTDNTYTYGGITSNKKASVLVRDDGPFIDVSVSDPTQLNTTGINLQIALDGGTLVSADAGVTVTQSTPGIIMSVSTAGANGKTFKARFYKLAPVTVDLAPVADSYVEDLAGKLDTNYGNASTIVVKKAGPGFNRESYLRFDVPAGGGVLLGAALKLTALTTTTPGVQGLFTVADTIWAETGITWNNKPATGSQLTSWTPAAGTVSTVNATGAVPGSGLVSFAIVATTETSNGFVTYASRNHATVTARPQLSLIYGHTPPDVHMTAPADGSFIATVGNVTLTAAAVATDGAVTSVAFYDGATLLGTDTAAPYSITPLLAGGPHYLTAVATDANNLTRTSFTTRVDVAYPPPVKAATGSALNVGTAWTPAFVPVNPDTATWDSTSLTGAMTLGADLSWASLIVKDPAAPLTFNGTQTLTLGSAGIDMSASTVNLTLNHPVILGENQTWNVGADRTLAANGRISGTGTLTKSGTGNSILSGTNTYTGTTTIDQGTLAFTTNNALTAGLNFGAAATNITPGILDLTSANATFGGPLLVNTNSATASEIKIATAQTLTINGNVQIGATTPAGGGTVTKLNMTGGGKFNATGDAGGTFRVGGSAIGTTSQVTTLDLTAIKATSINTSTTGTLRVNPVSGSQSSSRGVLLLPAPSVVDTIATTTITANTIAVGDSSTNGNNGVTTNVMGSVSLGTGLTTLNVNTINVGTGSRDVGQIIYGSTVGDLMIRAADGTSRATAINIATGGATGSNTGNSRIDLSGHDSDILVTSLNVGNQAKSGTVPIGTFELNFGEQTAGVGVGSLASKLDATNVNIGFRPGTATTTSTTTSKVNLYGGTVTFGNVGATGTGVDIGSSSYSGAGVAKTIGELNISGGNVTIHNGTGGFALRLGQSSAANGGIVTASMNLTGGTTTLGGDIVKGIATGTVNSTLKLAGGTLDLGGNDIGTATELITLTAESGTLQNVLSINGTGGLTKTTAGSLVISGTNTYTGDTTISGGTLALGANNALPATAVAIGSATLDAATFDDTTGTLDVTGSAVINLGAGANLVFADSSGIDWAGNTLNITGTFVSGSSLRFGTTSTGLTPTQLGKISASGFTSFGLDANGYLTATAGGFNYASWANDPTKGNIPGELPSGDFDNDGITNILEYALGKNPRVSSQPAGLLSGNTITYTKGTDAIANGDVSWVIETSQTLAAGSWTEEPVIPGATISFTFTPSTPAKKFARLKVTCP